MTASIQSIGQAPSFSKGEMTPVGIKDNTQSGILHKTFNTLAGAYKLQAQVEEYSSGLASGTAKGIVAGSAIMGADWVLRKVAGKGAEGQSWATPFKTAGSIVKNMFFKVIGLRNKTVAEIVKYPFYKGPKQLYNFIKEAQGVGKIGKILAPIVGLGVLATSLLQARIKINERTADVDHKFYDGHRTV